MKKLFLLVVACGALVFGGCSHTSGNSLEDSPLTAEEVAKEAKQELIRQYINDELPNKKEWEIHYSTEDNAIVYIYTGFIFDYAKSEQYKDASSFQEMYLADTNQMLRYFVRIDEALREKYDFDGEMAMIMKDEYKDTLFAVGNKLCDGRACYCDTLYGSVQDVDYDNVNRKSLPSSK